MVDKVFDLSVGYSGITADQIPYYEYLMDDVFFRGRYPKEIHIDVRALRVSDIPSAVPDTAAAATAAGKLGLDAVVDSDKKAFTTWIRERFALKDRRMSAFFERGSLLLDGEEVEERERHAGKSKKVVKLESGIEDWIALFATCYAFFAVFAPMYWYLITFLPKLAWTYI